ncbi:MAG: endolytic transglycosylase MltG [Actinomycetales bacterium]|nr:endolytic transglycosylase MltG [Actinomycetales bacterium]
MSEVSDSAPKLARKKIIGLLIAVAALGTFLVARFVLPPADYRGSGGQATKVTILSGQTASKIANSLKQAGVISSVDRFTALCATDSRCTSIQPGTYRLKTKLPVKTALSELLDAKNRIFSGLLIKEGLRNSEILQLLSDHTGIEISEFQKALRKPGQLGLPAWANQNAEGFLFPATYDIPKNSSTNAILRILIAKAVAEFDRIDLVKHAKSIGLTPDQLLTVASIVQAEAHPRDYEKVSRVILNRLALPMRLQMDSTVAYGLNKKQVILSTADLQSDTPYNTYIKNGLPPGPIGNPGVAAIKAAANPATGDWLFFITVDLNTQETKFTRSYDQFLIYKEEFLNFCQSNPGSC